MSDEEKHANDDYVDPTSATAKAPIPPEFFPEEMEEQKEEAMANAEEAPPEEAPPTPEAQATSGRKGRN